MVFNDPFAVPQGWKIRRWTPPDNNLIPANAFVATGTLLIGVVDGPANEARTYSLAWLTEGCRWCSITGLLLQAGSLKRDTSVTIPGEKPEQWCIALSIDGDGALHGDITAGLGEITAGPGDGNVGTFIAETQPPEFWPRWLDRLRSLFARRR